MHRLPALLLLCFSASGALAASTATVEQPARLGLCVACHGEDGRGRQPGQPHLNGQDPAYLQDALRQYRDGRRSGSVMDAMAAMLAPADLEALARWYAAQPCCVEPAAAAPGASP